MSVTSLSVAVVVGVRAAGDGVVFAVFIGFAVPCEHEASNTTADNNSVVIF